MVQVISPDVAIFSLPWLRLEVLRERFIAQSTDESQSGPLRDLIVGAFKLLEHTPVRQLGLNRDIRFAVDSEERWHAIGHALAPKEIWRKYVDQPGMKSLTIEAARRNDQPGTINITVRPIAETGAHGRNVVEVAVNNHFNLGQDTVAADAVNLIDTHWSESLDFAISLAKGVLCDALEQEQ